MLTENEIRPADLMSEQKRCYERDIARLMNKKNSFIHVACPACNDNNGAPIFSKYGMEFLSCKGCETIYASPRPSEKDLAEYYLTSENYAYWNKYIFPASEETRRERIFKPRVAMVAELCQRFQVGRDLMVEVGSGFGIFCQETMRQGLFKRVVGIEPTPDLASSCRQRGIEVIEKPVEQVVLDELLSNEKQVDVIAHFEVIEHLLNPKLFLEKCAELLHSGGLMILTCPNGKGFDIDVMKEISPAVDTEHLNLFNLESLAALLEKCGFSVIEKQTPGRLDAELVRNRALSGEFDLVHHPFLKEVLLDNWDEHGAAFQEFLIKQKLSSNMLIVARRL